MGHLPNTVTALLRRHGVELRTADLSSDLAGDAARLYRGGGSLARLGEKVAFDEMTVRRYLFLAGVVMPSPHQRQTSRRVQER